MADELATYRDSETGLTHLLEVTYGNDGGERFWFLCSPMICRLEKDEAHATPPFRTDIVITCLWCACGRRRS